MGKASRKKRQKEFQAESALKDKPLKSSETSPKWGLFNKPLVHFFLIAIVGFIVYSNAFNVPFHFDDTHSIVENYKVRDLSNFWPPAGSRWFGFLTFALNYYFGGLNVTGYHIFNLIIHIFNAILVYWLIMLTFRTPFFRGQNTENEKMRNWEDKNFSTSQPLNISTSIAFFSALIFVSHPIQTQAVTYIVQRFTSLATFFYLLSLVMYIKWRLRIEQQPSRSVEQQKKNGYCSAALLRCWAIYLLSLISAILAMKTKEIAFTLPIVITLYELSFFKSQNSDPESSSGRTTNLRRLLYLMPFLLTLLIIPLSLIEIDKPIGDAIGELREAAQETEEVPRWGYLFTQFRVIVTYIRLLFFPINQNLDYDYPAHPSFFNPAVFLSFLFLLSIFSLGIYLFYAKRYTLYATRFLAFGIFWFFITLSVESSIIPIKDIIFEHRVYLPSVGIIIAFVLTTFNILRFVIREPRRSLTINYLLLTTAVVALSIATYQRNLVWQDGVTLWEDVVKKSPEKARGHHNLGKSYLDKGWDDKAIEHYQIALRLKPDCAVVYYSLGMLYKTKGLNDKAIEYFQYALSSNLVSEEKGTIHNSLGSAYRDKGWTDTAIKHYQIALRLKPDYAEAHNNIGVVYERKGLLDEAIKEYQMALRLNPELEVARNNLNRLLQIKRK